MTGAPWVVPCVEFTPDIELIFVMLARAPVLSPLSRVPRGHAGPIA